MDTVKMGAFIRDLRRERNMTQKDLAQRLGITDRAVSKWERGLNAPDLSTLEPLARILEVTIGDLIAGERAEPRQEDLGAVIEYSREQTTLMKQVRRRLLAWGFTLGLLALALLGTVLWGRGFFHIEARALSPDGTAQVTVYSRDLTKPFAPGEDCVTVLDRRSEDLCYRSVYGGSFAGLWWSPAGGAYVLALDTDNGSRTLLECPGSTIELDAWLPLVTGEKAEYRFCQWAADGNHMLIHYLRPDGSQGYFWCSRSGGGMSGILELP